MAFKGILIISVAISLGSTEKGKRLIKYDLNEPAKWMTVEEMNQLLVDNPDGFIDLTREGVDITMTDVVGRQHVDYKYPAQPSQQERVSKVLSDLQKDNLEAHVRKLSSFHSRNPKYYFGESEAEGWLISEIKRTLIDYKGGRHSISIKFIGDHNQERYKQKNIILKLQGHDPNWLNELVILGAHYDSFNSGNQTPSAKCPGADSSADGCAVLLETLRLLVKSGIMLKHTVEFHFYTAREMGRIGSQEVVAKYKEEKRKVKGMLNFDRIGYGNTMAVADRNSGIRETNGPLTAFVKTLVKEYTEGVPITDTICYTSCLSDQISWHFWGYPAAYILEIKSPGFHHTVDDTIDKINFTLVNEFAKVAVAFVIELGKPIDPTPPAPASASKPGLKRMKVEVLFMCFGGFIYCTLAIILNELIHSV